MKRLIDNGIKFDTDVSKNQLEFNKKSITYFLEGLHEEISEFSNFEQQFSFVYKSLLEHNLDFSSVFLVNALGLDMTSFHQNWINELNSDNQNVFTEGDNLIIETGELKDQNKTINLFLPIDCKQIDPIILKLFNYLKQLNLNCLSIIRKKVGCNYVEMKFDVDDISSLEKIINIINNDKEIKDSFQKLSEFIPTINGIGIFVNDEFNYLHELSFYIVSFLNQKDQINCNQFLSYLEETDNPIDLKNILYCALGKTDDVVNLKQTISFEQKEEIINKFIVERERKLKEKMTSTNGFTPSLKHEMENFIPTNTLLKQAIIKRKYDDFGDYKKVLIENNKGFSGIYVIAKEYFEKTNDLETQNHLHI